MLEEIAEDNVTAVPASNQPMFRTDVLYDELASKRSEIVGKWRSLSPDERNKYTDQHDFEVQHNCPDLKDPALLPARNLSMLVNEVKERMNALGVLQLLPVESLDFDDALLELAESIENIVEIRSLYKLRKRTTGTSKNAGINAEEAGGLKNCFSQGRELYLAGKQGSLMVKPLNFFYALTAYSYGVIVLNNPLRFGKGGIPGSHGMAYLPDAIQAQFGGDSAKGTFSDLVTAFPAQMIKTTLVEFNIDCADSLINYYMLRHSVSLGTLLSLVPEMADYFKLTTGKPSRCYPLEISTVPDPRSLTWEFHIGAGETRPPQGGIDSAFPGLGKTERHGKVIVTVPASKTSLLRASIYTDMKGKLWYVDNPFYPGILPEIAIHFLINSMFSNVMRYRPDEWGGVIRNEVASNISLLTRHYFSTFQRKFFLVVLRSLSRYLPYAV